MNTPLAAWVWTAGSSAGGTLRHVDAQFAGVDPRQQPRQLVGVAVDEQVQ
ncbi:hypothetical protein [Streptomyces cellulosae]|nr:hypothetical protein [Streptomyces cellulosae]